MAAPAMEESTARLADIDEPQPGPGQVAIDSGYAGVNFIDVMARKGGPGYATAWPYIPGLEVAGHHPLGGRRVHDLHVGERVAAFTPGGGMDEVATAAADVTVEMPPGVPLGTAASAVSLARAGGEPRCWSGPGMRLSRRRGAGRNMRESQRRALVIVPCGAANPTRLVGSAFEVTWPGR
jgi:hypothetical protein